MRRLLGVPLLLLLAACRDPVAEHFAHAKLEYDRLVMAAANPRARGFDAVLEELRSVPDGTKHAPEARKLEAAILGARGGVRIPLAKVPGPHDDAPPLLVAQRAACARLAELAGRDGGVDERALAALNDCRQKVERLDAEWAHQAEPQPPDAG
jgi:hypothetical protein